MPDIYVTNKTFKFVSLYKFTAEVLKLCAKPQHSEMYCTQLGSLLSFAELDEHLVNGARERSQHGNALRAFRLRPDLVRLDPTQLGRNNGPV